MWNWAPEYHCWIYDPHADPNVTKGAGGFPVGGQPALTFDAREIAGHWKIGEEVDHWGRRVRITGMREDASGTPVTHWFYTMEIIGSASTSDKDVDKLFQPMSNQSKKSNHPAGHRW